MQRLRSIVSLIDCLSGYLGRLAAIFAPVMVGVTCYVVFTRYVLNSGSVAVQELVIYANAIIFTVGAGYTLKQGGHVRVDIFYSGARPRTKALVDLFGTLFLLIPTCVFILWICWRYVGSAWAIREASPDTGGLPYIYLLKTMMLVLAGTLLLQGLAEVLRNVLRLLPGGAATQEEAQH
jgi:TRAP-type mannitol/chloroaromatic compound transport system permease small subunit